MKVLQQCVDGGRPPPGRSKNRVPDAHDPTVLADLEVLFRVSLHLVGLAHWDCSRLGKNRCVDDRRTLPLLVLISGAPRSGKSTLAAELAAGLGLPRLSRDELWSGLRFTHQRGAPAIVATRGIAAEYGALEHLLAVGVSVVADGTLYRGEMEGNVRRLCDLADVVNLHCVSSVALDRYRQRQLDAGVAVEVVDATLLDLEARGGQFTAPLDLACRQILVTNETGFDPSIDELIAALA